MRPIDADAFRKILSEHEMRYDGKRLIDEFAYGATSAYEHAGDLLDEMPTIMTFTLADIEEQYRKGMEKGLEEAERTHGEWIPCSERLPEENKTVIASTKYGVFPEAMYTKEDGWTWAYESGADYWEELEDVTAWMPLPDPYKEEGETK